MNIYSDILDNQILQDLQDSYVSTLPVYAWCYGRPYVPLTAFSGNEEERAFFDAHISEETKKIILASFSDGDTENVILADADVPYISVCGIAIRDTAGVTLGAWIFAGVCMEAVPADEGLLPGLATTTMVEFDHIITLIAKTSGLYFAAHGRSVTADVKLADASSAEEALADERAKNDAVKSVLSMLETEKDFGVAVSDILAAAGKYLRLSDALLLRTDKNVGDVDVVSDFTVDDGHSVVGHFLKMTRGEIPFLTGREYTVSSDSIMPDTFRDFFRKQGITAGVFLPIEAEDMTQMYLCFIMRHESRKWKLPELTFLNEIKCVVNALLASRVRENSLAGAYATLDGVLENGAEGLVVAEADAKEYIYANERFGQMLSDPKDSQGFFDMVQGLMDKEVTDTGYFADASKRWYNVHSAPIRWMDGRNVRLVTLYDVTETKRYEQKIEEQAKTDYLTGLYNRQQFERDLSIAVKDAVRGGDQGSFLYINLDDFKDVNGEYGHSLGDALLKEAARAITSICKAKATCYRIGGDEFGVLVPFYEYTELNRLVGTIQRRFEQSWQLDGAEYSCTMSMGVVCFPKDGKDIKALMQHADIALSAAKEKAPGMVEWYSKRDERADLRRSSLEKTLRAAIAEDGKDFVADYEPLVDKGNNVCLGARAHIRWQTENLPAMAEEEFLKTAESLGVTPSVELRLLEDALRHCRYWNDFGEPGYYIFVELSVMTFLSHNAAMQIKEVIDETGINPANVRIGVRGEVPAREQERFLRVCDEIEKTGAAVLEADERTAEIEPHLAGSILTGTGFEEKYM